MQGFKIQLQFLSSINLFLIKDVAKLKAECVYIFSKRIYNFKALLSEYSKCLGALQKVLNRAQM